MERMSEHTGLVSSYQLLITAACKTQAARWKAATPEQLTGAHLYLDIVKSGYIFHAVGNVMFLPRVLVCQNPLLEGTSVSEPVIPSISF